VSSLKNASLIEAQTLEVSYKKLEISKFNVEEVFLLGKELTREI
jgi:hypothetical protein